MAHFVIFSNVHPTSGVVNLDARHKAVQARTKRECPGVSFRGGYALEGGYEVLDIVEADDIEEVRQAAKIIEEDGHAKTRVVLAYPWRDFVGQRSRPA